MSSIAVTASATGTGVVSLVAPATNTNRTLTLPDSNGTVLTTATAGVPVNGPAFSAYATVGVSTPTTTFTKVLFDTEEFDTNGNFASSRFTPTIAGYYQITAGITGGFATQLLTVYKNGAEYKRGAQANGTSMTQSTALALVYCNGSTDYIEIYWFQASGSTVTSGVGQALTYFQAAMIRSAT